MDGERTIAAKTRPRKRSAAEVAPAAEMHATAEVPATMAAEMATTVKVPSTSVTSASVPASVPASTVATAASRGCETCSRQRGRKNNNGNANIEF
jgi:hypothetical protein